MDPIATDFRRWGWLGLWLQLLFGAMPILMGFGSLFLTPTQFANRPIPWWTYLAYVCPLVLIFTIYWCYRYTCLSNQLRDPDLRPPKATVIRSIQIGLIVNLIGMAFAILVALGQVTTLWFRMSALPPGASTITTATPGTVVLNPGSLVLPLQVIGVLAMVCTIAATWIGVCISLILLLSVNRNRNSRAKLQEDRRYTD